VELEIITWGAKLNVRGFSLPKSPLITYIGVTWGGYAYGVHYPLFLGIRGVSPILVRARSQWTRVFSFLLGMRV